MLENATRICSAKFGVLWLHENGGFRCVSLHNAPAEFAGQYRRQPMVYPPPGTGLRHLADTRQVAHVADMTKIQPYLDRDPFVVASVELGGYRTVVNVPMLKDDVLIGAIGIYRQEVQPVHRQANRAVSNISPRRPSSPSRIRGCSTSCGESLAAADRNGRRARNHQPLDLRSAGCARHTDGICSACVPCRQGQHRAPLPNRVFSFSRFPDLMTIIAII